MTYVIGNDIQQAVSFTKQRDRDFYLIQICTVSFFDSKPIIHLQQN